MNGMEPETSNIGYLDPLGMERFSRKSNQHCNVCLEGLQERESRSAERDAHAAAATLRRPLKFHEKPGNGTFQLFR